MQSVVPTISVSALGTFNPQNPLAITVSASVPDAEAVQSVTVDWGDGTEQTFDGPPGSYAHQYAIANAPYTIQVSVTDPNGTFTAPGVAVEPPYR